MRLVDADELKETVINDFDNLQAYFPKDFIKEIDNAPTVEERPQGVWLAHADYDFICSNCNTRALEMSDLPYLSSYCPFCGAEMEIET